MAETLFKKLVYLEEAVEHGTITAEVAELATAFVSFVASGVYTTSEVEQFIAKNFRLSNKALTLKYNKMHPNSMKSEHTFRSQVSRLNKSLCSMFGYEAEVLYEGFINCDKQILRRVADIIQAFAVGELSVAGRFCFNIEDYLPTGAGEASYALADCSAEMQFLRSIDCRELEKRMESLDMDKLAFLIGELSRPLYSRVRSGNKDSVVVSVMNECKLAFIKEFAKTKPYGMAVVYSAGVLADASEPAPETLSKMPANYHGLHITREMLGMIENRACQPLSMAEQYAVPDYEELISEYEQFLYSLTPAYPVKKLASWLETVNNSYFAVVWQNIKNK